MIEIKEACSKKMHDTWPNGDKIYMVDWNTIGMIDRNVRSMVIRNRRGIKIRNKRGLID